MVKPRLPSSRKMSSPSAQEDDQDRREEGGRLGKMPGVRFLILTLSTIAFATIFSNALTLNFAVICMTKEVDSGNATTMQLPKAVEPLFTNAEKNVLFALLAVGNIVGSALCSPLIDWLGVRAAFAIFGVASSLSTFVAPLLTIHLNAFWSMAVVRIVHGTGYAILFPLIGKITDVWAPTKETGTFLAVISLYFQFSPVFTMPVSGALCHSPTFGWTSVFYLHGLVSALFVALFYWFYTNRPEKHTWVGDKELLTIADDGSREPINEEDAKTPYLAIWTSWRVWVHTYIALSINYVVMLSLQYSPTYLNKVLGIDVRATGLFGALPNVVAVVAKIVAGIGSDRLTCVSPIANVRIWQTVALGGAITALVGLANLEPGENAPLLALALLVICSSFIGVSCAGVFKSMQLYARQHTAALFALVSMLNCVVFLVMPVVVGLLAPHDSPDEWRTVFYVTAGSCLFSAILFLIFGVAEPAKWTRADRKKDDADKAEQTFA